MKNYNLDEINEFIEKKKKEKKVVNLENDQFEYDSSYSYISNNSEQVYSIEEFDNAKTRILKYIFYKKRTEYEVKQKFKKIYSDYLLQAVIDNLKELGYINDINYIERALNEFITLKNLSIKEIKYKLIEKGIKSNKVEDYISEHYDELLEYEKKSAKTLANKKKCIMEERDVRIYLMKKGYKEESIKEAI